MSSKEKLVKSLSRAIRGEIRSDRISQKIYSIDASIFSVEPTLVVLPKCKEDLLAIVEIARETETPIIPRGGATGITGGCLGTGVVVDTSKYLNEILEVNLDQKWVRCQPGVIQDQLNAKLSPNGYRLGPETSAGNRATIGGMTATNATGSHFLHYGNMVDHVLEVEMILSSGETLRLNENSDLHFDIPKDIPKFRRSSSGYPLYSLLDKPYNPAKLTVGSEGTLGLFSEIKLNLCPTIDVSSLVILFFDSIEESLEAVPHILSSHPLSLELIDHHVIEMGRLHPNLSLDWLKGDPKAMLVAEYATDSPPTLSSHQKIFRTGQEQIWALRKAGLGLLLSRRSYSRAIAFIEDLSVPPDHLAPFLRDLKKIVKREMGIYGHAGDGCLHIRPYLDVREDREFEWMFKVMEEVADLVHRYGGVMSGEHGDGFIRSWLNPKSFEGPIYEAMCTIKNHFDPLNLMNPGKIIGARRPENIRKSHPKEISTLLDFEKEGGLYLAADLCNGNGACRKKSTLMCPSFQAFGDERHSTRARAQSLRAAINGEIALDDPELIDVLDYCLECKGCKTECPSQVDMAKMKMEVLFQYQEKHGIPLLDRLFGNLPELAKWGISPPSWLLSFLGVAKERPFPRFAKERFSSWWKKRPQMESGKLLSLFIDTFTEYFSPEVGKAAVEILERNGYGIKVISGYCCGRTLLSKGMLRKAKTYAEALIKRFEYEENPILVLEPSCLSAIQDDYPGLIRKTFPVISIEALLPPINKEVFLHPHCHDQALKRTEGLEKVFPRGILSQAGCCGLAGSFGYEKRHYPMSMAIGESRLFPQIRELREGMPIIASGFSCRHQIAHGTGYHALHPAEYARIQF